MDAIFSPATSADSSTTPITPECAAEILGRLSLVPDRRADRATATPTPPVKPAKPSGTPLIELRHMDDPLDSAFASLASQHGDKVSALADYPDFAARFATKEADRG